MSVAGILASNLFSNALSHTSQSNLSNSMRPGSPLSTRETGMGSFADQLLQQAGNSTSTQSAANQHTAGAAPVATSPTRLSSLHLQPTQSTSLDSQSQALQAYSSLQQNSMNNYLGNWLNSANSLSVNA